MHAKRTYRELRYLKHMRHENVSKGKGRGAGGGGGREVLGSLTISLHVVAVG